MRCCCCWHTPKCKASVRISADWTQFNAGRRVDSNHISAYMSQINFECCFVVYSWAVFFSFIFHRMHSLACGGKLSAPRRRSLVFRLLWRFSDSSARLSTSFCVWPVIIPVLVHSNLANYSFCSQFCVWRARDDCGHRRDTHPSRWRRNFDSFRLSSLFSGFEQALWHRRAQLYRAFFRPIMKWVLFVRVCYAHGMDFMCCMRPMRCVYGAYCRAKLQWHEKDKVIYSSLPMGYGLLGRSEPKAISTHMIMNRTAYYMY